MKRLFQLALVLLPVLAITSCNSDDDSEAIDELIGTYVGAMNIDTPSFTNAQYTVAVSKLSGTRVRMTPSTGVASTWEANLTDVLGVFTCISCVTNDQITFTKISGRYQLTYNYDDNNEQFAGLKQ
jgi:hypothetical protein